VWDNLELMDIEKSPIMPPLDLDMEFGSGATKLVETAIGKNMDFLRQSEPDIYLLRNLGIASRVLLGETVINADEMLLVLKDIWPEWYKSLSGDKTDEANLHSFLIARDYNLLTGNQIATPEHIDRIKRGAKSHVNFINDGFFSDPERRVRILDELKRHTRNFELPLREDAGKHQIDFLKMMADMIVIKVASVEVKDNGAVEQSM